MTDESTSVLARRIGAVAESAFEESGQQNGSDVEQLTSVLKDIFAELGSVSAGIRSVQEAQVSLAEDVGRLEQRIAVVEQRSSSPQLEGIEESLSALRSGIAGDLQESQQLLAARVHEVQQRATSEISDGVLTLAKVLLRGRAAAPAIDTPQTPELETPVATEPVPVGPDIEDAELVEDDEKPVLEEAAVADVGVEAELEQAEPEQAEVEDDEVEDLITPAINALLDEDEPVLESVEAVEDSVEPAEVGDEEALVPSRPSRPAPRTAKVQMPSIEDVRVPAAATAGRRGIFGRAR